MPPDADATRPLLRPDLPYQPYAELHCHSNFSFLDGVSHPEQLAEEAARLELEALAVTDHDGLYGVVRFAEAAQAVGLPTVFGAELTLTPDPKRVRREEETLQQQRIVTDDERHLPDPHGEHLLVIADGPPGYAALATAISLGHLAGEKGSPQFGLHDLAATGAGKWWVLTGCRKGTVPRALVRDGPRAAANELGQLIELFGRDRVLVELWDHGDPLDSVRNDALAELAMRHDVSCVATNNVHYATPAQRRLATAVAAVRARRSLDELDPWLPAATSAHLRSGAEQQRRFRRYPGVVDLAAEIGRAAAFDLSLVAPSLPPFPCPGGISEMAYLRVLVDQGWVERYGTVKSKAWHTLQHELEVIETLGFAGYFLVVWEIVEYCKHERILCQGRGARRTARSATRWASPTPTRWTSACCSSGSSRRSVTDPPTSTSTSRATGARRSSSTCTRATAGTTPPRSPT